MYHTIYHISDIHIRLYSRRQEYQLVFDRLYTYLRAQKHLDQSILVVTGDILHNKIDLQPECTLMTYEFLRQLGSILPTIVIAGNHDALLNNRDRIDSLTSILHDRHPPNVYYYTKTGLYRHDNLVFLVHSLLDDEWIRASEVVREQPTDILVGLYHGQIQGWKNCHGYVSETGEKEVSDFIGCDYVLLGDIHKHQFMNKEKTMAYAGSLLSQNFGETDDDHGVLIWDLKKKTTRFHRVENEYAYKEFHAVENEQGGLCLSDGTRPFSLSDAPLPPKGNVKIFLTPGQDLSVPSVLRKAFPGTRFQFPMLAPEKKSGDSTTTTTRVEASCQEMETILKDFLVHRWPGETPDMRKQLHRDLMKDFYANMSNAAMTTGWQLEYLHFGHLFGYGSDNRIDLEKAFPKHTVTGIFGKNSAGKSTLIDILAFMLYGKITRSSHGNSTPKEVIHFQEKTGWGEVGLRLGSLRYVLRKVCTRNQDKIKMVETFFEVDDQGHRTQLTEEQRKKTDKLVQSMIGGYKTFVYTNLFLQQREESFRDMKQAARKDFLYELFGLDGFEKYRKTKDDEWKAVRGEEGSLRKRIEHHSKAMWEEEEQTLVQACSLLRERVAKDKEHLVQLAQEREACFEKLWPCTHASLESLRAKKKELETLEKKSTAQKARAVQEKEECAVFLAQHNLEELEAKMLDAPVMDVEDENDNDIFQQYGPHRSTCTYEEWQTVYQGIQKSVASSSETTKQWKQKEAEYREEIRTLQASLPVYDPSHLLSDDRDWLAWTQHYEAQVVRQQQESEEWDRLQKESSDHDRDDDDKENVLVALEKSVQELQGVQCRYEILRQQITTDKSVVFNKACTSCMNNPHYLQRKENVVEAKRLKTRVAALEQQCQSISSSLGIQEEKISSCWGDALGIVRDMWSKKRRQQQQNCVRQQQILEHRKSFAVLETRYKNTAAYRKARKIEVKVQKLEKQMAVDPLQKKFLDTVQCLENLSLYTRMDEMWKQYREGGVASLLETVSQCRQYQQKRVELEKKMEEWSEQIVQCRVSLETLRVEETWFLENETLHTQIQDLDAQKKKREAQLLETEEEWRDKERQCTTMAAQYEQWTRDKEAYDQSLQRSHYLELLVATTERDGLPLFLLKRKLPMIENDVNHLLSPFLDKKLVLCVEDKDVVVGVETLSGSKKVSNYLGGMESFLVDLSLKLGFSKFANLPRANLFIIDEGISVLDQERISNISHLFDFLSHITDHVLLISHLPTIKDFVHQSMEIVKDDATQKSRLVMG